MAECPKCGAPVQDGAVACPYCNASLVAENAATAPDSAIPAPNAGVKVHKTSNQQWVAFILGIFGVHDFMLGNPVRGAIKAGITLFVAGLCVSLEESSLIAEGQFDALIPLISEIWSLADLTKMSKNTYKCGVGHVLKGKGQAPFGFIGFWVLLTIADFAGWI